MGIMSVKISDYCKGCAFLCKTDKEYCPNRKSIEEAHRIAEQMNIKRMENLYKIIKEEK